MTVSLATNSVVLLLLCFHGQASVHGADLTKFNHKLHLLQDLLGKENNNSYSKFVIPSEPLSLTVGLQLTGNAALVESEARLYISAYLSKSWTDPKLAWNESDYGGISEVRVPISEIWSPDIEVFAGNMDVNLYHPAHLALVYSSGSVSYIPQVLIDTHCQMDLSDYPYDEHECQFKIGSWTYDGNTLDIKFSARDNPVDMDHVSGSWPFKLTTTSGQIESTVYDCCPDAPYISLLYKFTLRRISTFATHLAVTPAAILCFLIPAMFILPAGSSSKIFLGVGILVTDVLMLNFLVTTVMGMTHPTVPKIASYYLATMVLVSLSLAFTAVIENIWWKRYTGGEVPRVVKKIVIDMLGRVLCCPKPPIPHENVGFGPISDMEGSSIQDGDQVLVRSKSRAPQEWQHVAVILDRLLLIIFMIIVVITSFTMIR